MPTLQTVMNDFTFFGVMGLFNTLKKNKYTVTRDKIGTLCHLLCDSLMCPGAGLEALANPGLNSFGQDMFELFNFLCQSLLNYFAY